MIQEEQVQQFTRLLLTTLSSLEQQLQAPQTPQALPPQPTPTPEPRAPIEPEVEDPEALYDAEKEVVEGILNKWYREGKSYAIVVLDGRDVMGQARAKYNRRMALSEAVLYLHGQIGRKDDVDFIEPDTPTAVTEVTEESFSAIPSKAGRKSEKA